MSQESQKFPLGSILPVFCDSHLFEKHKPHFRHSEESLGILLFGGVWGKAGTAPALKPLPGAACGMRSR